MTSNSYALFLLIILMLAGIACNRFDPEDWKANKNRSKQVNSLVRSKKLLDKSYNEVVGLPGKEDLPWEDSVYNNGIHIVRIEYLTGGGSYIDFERLSITFTNDKATSAFKHYD